MSAPYPAIAAATEASRNLDIDWHAIGGSIQEFRPFFGDATLDPLRSPGARPSVLEWTSQK